jgi:hypothetical protein
MEIGGIDVKTLWGGALAAGSGLLAVVDPQAIAVSFVGVVAGTALGIYGVGQTIDKRNYNRLHERIDDLEGRLSKAKDEAAEWRRKWSDSQCVLEAAKADLADEACPWLDGAGRARCYRADEPRAIEPDEVFERNQGAQ